MDSKVDNYKASIESFIKEGNITEAISAVDDLARHAFRLGVESNRAEGVGKATFLDKDGMMPDDDNINPTHYTSYDPEVDIDCRTAMRAAFGKENVKQGFLQNAFEYIWRSSSKGKNVDIQKAIRELQMFLELGGFD